MPQFNRINMLLRTAVLNNTINFIIKFINAR